MGFFALPGKEAFQILKKPASILSKPKVFDLPFAVLRILNSTLLQ